MMNAEQFKMLMEAFASLSDAGKQAFIWWLVFDKGLFALVGLLVTVCVFAIAWRAVSSIQAASTCDRVRQLFGYSGYSDPFFHGTYAKAQELVNAQQKQARTD